jgi:hypothetical protein
MSRDGGEQSTWYGITCWKVWAQGFGSGWAGEWSLKGWCCEPMLDAAACSLAALLPCCGLSAD